MYRRRLHTRITEAMKYAPVVLLQGPRQAGKTTLARQFAAASGKGGMITLDNSTQLAAARSDPTGYLASLPSRNKGPIVIDEVQRAPELFLAIKEVVDREKKPGRFLLTGSANVLAMPRLGDSLAGRLRLIPLWPLADAEIDGVAPGLYQHLTGERFTHPAPATTEAEDVTPQAVRRALRGGYPHIVGLDPDAPAAARERREWFESYISTLLDRDVRDLSNIEQLSIMPRVLALLAARAANILNASDISRTVELPYNTLRRYLALLDALFLVRFLEPWFANVNVSLTKSPKVLISDTGLMAHILRLTPASLKDHPTAAGPLLENYVIMELIKHASWAGMENGVSYFRTSAGREVDCILEDESGRLTGIEIKAASEVRPKDFNGIEAFRDIVGKRFRRGIVLYGGRETVAFGRDLYAVPLSVIWTKWN